MRRQGRLDGREDGSRALLRDDADAPAARRLLLEEETGLGRGEDVVRCGRALGSGAWDDCVRCCGNGRGSPTR